MWWPTHARAPFATRRCSSAPRRRRGAANRSPPGAPSPRHVSRERSSKRPRPATTRTTESFGSRLDRPVVQQERGSDPGQPLARGLVAVGDRLGRRISDRHDQRCRPRRPAAVVQRRVGRITPRSLDAGPRPAPPRRGRRVPAPRAAAARRGDPSRRGRGSPARATSRSPTIRAKGLSSRCFRARSSATTESSSAGRRDEKPHQPLTATIAPSSSARAAARG